VDDLVGDPASFDASFRRLFATAYQAAFRILGSRAEAEEVAQETLARCLVRWRRVAPYAEAWVSRTAVNLAIDVYRHRSKAPPPTRGEHVNPPDRLVELRADLVRALRLLSRRQRDVVVMRYLVELPEREVAQLLGCSEGTVKRHATRGLAALRRELGITFGPVRPGVTDSDDVHAAADQAGSDAHGKPSPGRGDRRGKKE
jgi:RNA polymerase sigma factor (sigma-70 family)